MKTAMGNLKEELINYRNESGNDSIDIDLLIKGIDGIYGQNEKQQIIDAVNSQRQLGWDEKGEQYYKKTFGEL